MAKKILSKFKTAALILLLSTIYLYGQNNSFVCVSDVNQYFYTNRESKLAFQTDLFYKDNYVLFPTEIGPWQGELSIQTEDPDAMMWYFKNKDTNESLFFMRVYGNMESNFHIPEVCYINDGWNLRKREYRQLKIGDKKVWFKYTKAEFEGEYQHVYYLFLWKNASRNMATEGAYMLRFSVVDFNEKPVNSDRICKNFIKAFINTQFGGSDAKQKTYPVVDLKNRLISSPDENMTRLLTPSIASLKKYLSNQLVPNPIIPHPVHKRYGLVLSYSLSPDSKDYKYTFSRSALYDNALAVIAFVTLEENDIAAKIINGTMRSAKTNGDLWFSMNTHNTWPSDIESDGAIIRSGASCWMGYAICYYILSELIKDPNGLNNNRILAEYLEFAEKLASPILKRQITDSDDLRYGLVTGGYGTYTYTKENIEIIEKFVPGEVIWCSSEHNIDAFFFLYELGYITKNTKYSDAAELIKKGLINNYNNDEEQLNRGVNPAKRDTVMALDCASWAAIFFDAINNSKLASNSLASSDKYTNKKDKTYGYKPYINLPIHESRLLQSYYYPDTPDYGWDDIEFTWSEGSLGVAVAMIRMGKKKLGYQILEGILRSESHSNGGIKYTDTEIPYQFTTAPSSIGTAWAILAAKMLEGGEIANLFWSVE